MNQKKKLCLQGLIIAFGFWVTGLGGSFFIGSNLGSDGFTMTTQGLATQLGLSVGTASTLLSLFVMLVVFFVDRSYVGVGTIISLMMLGPSIDFWSWMCHPVHQFLNRSFPLQLVCVACAIVIVALGISIVMSAHVGTHINDAVPVLLSKTLFKRWQFRISKILWDFFLMTVGVLLGGIFGVGTVLSAIFLGPVLQVTIPLVENVVKRCDRQHILASVD